MRILVNRYEKNLNWNLVDFGEQCYTGKNFRGRSGLRKGSSLTTPADHLHSLGTKLYNGGVIDT